MQDDKDKKGLSENKNQPPEDREIRDDKGRFQKGVSGNPVGRPKGETKTTKPAPSTIVKRLLSEKLEENNFAKLHAVLDNMIEEAIGGCPKARTELLNRYAGLPKQDEDSTAPIEITVRYTQSDAIDADDNDIETPPII